MSHSAERRKRRERYERNLQHQIEEALEQGDTGGMYYVFDRDTKTKTKGLNRKQAYELWRSLPRSFIFPQAS